MTDNLVLFFEVPAEHLGRLVYGMLDLDRNAASRLRLLDNLFTMR